ncbi:holin family protein [Silicimonas sp. MF1-12-2]|uniref:holin family protein n=1 Tax=Silicimonas sp. MF1-12-2 TaxID=3384793 RepID=UPI0039B3EDAE
MGLIGNILGVVFGGGRNAVRETIEVFRPNAEAEAVRSAAREAAALAQFASEFAFQRQGLFDRVIDGLNRLPRPFLAFGVLGLFVAALVDPVWFAARMQGIALVPEPLWWLMGAIVSFYFGARHQVKAQDYQRGLAETLARTPEVMRHIRDLEALAPEDADEEAPSPEVTERDGPEDGEENAALDDWRRSLGR